MERGPDVRPLRDCSFDRDVLPAERQAKAVHYSSTGATGRGGASVVPVLT